MDVWMDGWNDGRMDGWKEMFIFREESLQTEAIVRGALDGRMMNDVIMTPQSRGM